MFIWLSSLIFCIFASMGEGYLGLLTVCGLGIFYAVWRKRRGSDDFEDKPILKKSLGGIKMTPVEEDVRGFNNGKMCTTCWRKFEKIDLCIYDGEWTCTKCAAKFIKYAFGRDK